MVNIQEHISSAQDRPVATGVFAVLAVFSVSVAVAFASGIATPEVVHAFDILPPCCTVPITPIIAPPIIFPTLPPIPVVEPPAPDVLPPCCTLPDTFTPPPAPVVPPPDILPPCCTVPDSTTPVPPTVIPPPDILPPCCTVPDTTPPVSPPVTPPVTPPVVIPPVVIPPPVTPPPVCTHDCTPPPPPVTPLAECILLTATPTEIAPGDAVTLAWQTKNATSITIDNGVGSVAPVAAGSTIVHPTTDTTYIATVTGATNSVHCQAAVHVTATPPPGGGGGSCVQLTADKTSIAAGDAVTLSWVTSNASSVSIDNGVGVVTPTASGTTVVHPTEATTYSAVVPGQTVQTACQVHIDIPSTPPPGGGCVFGCGGGGGGGGGGSGPHVLLASSQPLASVYLSQIPYTGLDLGPVGTVVYWLMLILWSLAAAYLILFMGVPLALRRAKSFGGNVQQALNTPTPAPVAHEAPAPIMPPPAPAYVAAPEPIAHIAPVQMITAASIAPAAPSIGQLSREGFKSFATGDALTIDDIVKGLSRESGMVFTQHLAEEPVVAAHMDSHAAVVEAAVAEEKPAYAAPTAPAPVAQVAPMTYSDDISGFLAALLSGDRETVYGTLRAVNRAGADTQEFLAHAVCALDDAYRARIDGTAVHPEIARITSDCATNFLERLVSSLATAIDSSYSAGITGAKLAVTRALGIVNG